MYHMFHYAVVWTDRNGRFRGELFEELGSKRKPGTALWTAHLKLHNEFSVKLLSLSSSTTIAGEVIFAGEYKRRLIKAQR